MSRLLLFALASAAALQATPCVAAFPPSGRAADHGDWQLACDNSGTCRAAGYQPDDSELAVSVLLTRKAGPGEELGGEVKLGNYGDEPMYGDLPSPFPLSLRIDGKFVGTITIERNDLHEEIPPRMIDALLRALRRNTRIEWRGGAYVWPLSDKGASAVFLAMDEYQGRLGTPGALVRRGTRDEAEVPPAEPEPEVRAIAARPPTEADAQLAANPPEALLIALRATLDDDHWCDFIDGSEPPREMSVLRLSDRKLLLVTPCWMAAYNSGGGAWVINDRPPFEPVLVTNSASDVNPDGSLSASLKGRGLGDCWSQNEWAWDGQAYVETAVFSTGMCKLVEPGGAWVLPTRVTRVVRDKAP